MRFWKTMQVTNINHVYPTSLGIIRSQPTIFLGSLGYQRPLK